MALSRIWSAFIIVAVIVAAIRCFFFGDSDIFTWMVIGKANDPANPLKIDGIIETCWVAVEICLRLIGILTLFIGFMSIAERAGGVRLLARIVGPFFSKLFPQVPKGHPSMGHMIMNFSANLLGLDNAATPFGLKAMQSLQEVNPEKDTASNSQIMFMVLHASGLTLIPVAIIAQRVILKSNDPTAIFLPCLMATFVATVAAMTIVSIRQRINLFQPVIILWVGGITLILALLVFYMRYYLTKDGVTTFSKLLSNGLIFLIFIVFIVGALWKKVNVFDAFIDGAKQGFETAVKIIPYLVGMLVAIGVLRSSGVFQYIEDGLVALFSSFGWNTDFVSALPTALMKPLSGSGSRAMMIDVMRAKGPDSFPGLLACVFQGSSDTTLYIVALYFGSVGIKKTRYAVQSALLADLVGVIAAIFIAYLFFH